MGQVGPGLCAIPLWVRLDHQCSQHVILHCLSLGQAGPPVFTARYSALSFTESLRPGQHSSLSHFGSLRSGQRSSLSHSGSLRSDQGSALSLSGSLRQDRGYTLSVSGSGRTTMSTALCTIPLWVRPDHHVHSTLYNSSLGQAGPQCPQHVLHCPSLGH